jgi:hypothetical protein
VKKMHLRATVPNEGAHRLCWWLADGEAQAERLARHDVDEGKIDRLLSGELEPGADMAHAVFLATDGAVCSRDWRIPSIGGWGDRPVQRDTRAAA